MAHGWCCCVLVDWLIIGCVRCCASFNQKRQTDDSMLIYIKGRRGYTKNTNSISKSVCTLLGPIYTKRQCQCSVNAVMMLVIHLLLRRMESLQKWVATPFSSDSIVVIDSCMTFVITALALH